MSKETTNRPCPHCLGVGFHSLPPGQCFVCHGSGIERGAPEFIPEPGWLERDVARAKKQLKQWGIIVDDR